MICCYQYNSICHLHMWSNFNTRDSFLIIYNRKESLRIYYKTIKGKCLKLLCILCWFINIMVSFFIYWLKSQLVPYHQLVSVSSWHFHLISSLVCLSVSSTGKMAAMNAQDCTEHSTVHTGNNKTTILWQWNRLTMKNIIIDPFNSIFQS